MSWKNVQYENGKYRTSEGGGGGSSTFAGLDDVNFANIQNGQVPKYNSTTQKWENANESGGGGTVTDVQVDGTSVVNPQGVAEITMPTPPTIPVTDVKVNGTSVVDGNKEAQIKSYKEVTQAEYNALPASKTNDGILYCIKDAGGADGFPPLIYSLEEREIGVWTDGKPLYQITKIVNAGSTISVSGLSIKHAYAFATTVDGVYRPIPYNDGYYTVWWMQQNTISFASYSGDVSTYTITYQYTKTTDTAGSGTWTTDGTYAHHYSKDEKVIGTWIDGKPLYEKVLNLPNVSVGANAIQHGILNLASMISITGKCTYGDGTRGLCIPFLSSSTYWITIANITSSQFTLEFGNGLGSIQNCTITMQYTKTTD